MDYNYIYEDGLYISESLTIPPDIISEIGWQIIVSSGMDRASRHINNLLAPFKNRYCDLSVIEKLIMDITENCYLSEYRPVHETLIIVLFYFYNIKSKPNFSDNNSFQTKYYNKYKEFSNMNWTLGLSLFNFETENTEG